METKKTDYRGWCRRMRRQLAELKERNRQLADSLAQELCSNRQLQLQVKMYADKADGFSAMLNKSFGHFDRSLEVIESLSAGRKEAAR